MADPCSLSVSELQSSGEAFNTIENSFLEVFEAAPLRAQPRFLVLFRFGDVSVLEHLIRLITERCARGRNLSDFPLDVIILESDSDSVRSKSTLVESMDIQLNVSVFQYSDLKSQDILDFIQSQKLTDFRSENALFVLADLVCDAARAEGKQVIACLPEWISLSPVHGVIDLRVKPGKISDTFGRDYLLGNAQNHTYPRPGLWAISENAAKDYCLSVGYFQRRSYLARHPVMDDLPALQMLERDCWPEKLCMSTEILSDRIVKNPHGHIVIEEDGIVLGVIYSQRIEDVTLIDTALAATVDKLHNDQGSIAQLLAVNIHPDMQHRSLGDQVLEFLLQCCSAQREIRQVVGVTRCKDYAKNTSVTYENYIHLRNSRGRLVDTVLRFHENHGAVIERVMLGYRPDDTTNISNGVLVSYDIKHRKRPEFTQAQVLNSITEKAVDTQLTIKAFVVKAFLQRLSASSLKEIDLDAPLMEMGLDSADLLELSEIFSARFADSLSAIFFFQHNTAAKVIKYFESSLTALQNASDKHKLSPSKEANNTEQKYSTKDIQRDIAIVGVACKLPGGVENLDDLWDLLTTEKDAITAYPSSRWDWPEDIDPSKTHLGIDQGGFIEGIEQFDAAFFRISPREAALMDPQQRIMLELSWSCLEDAGYAASSLSGSRTGVYIGASGSDYQLLLNERLSSIDAYTGLATSMAILPNRISYFYDFTGPSIQIDTACSSSLVAIQRAVDELRSGACEQALVGGLHLMCHPMSSIAYYKAGMLAPDARCKTFDDRANGYVRSEGAVITLLKPLAKALEDNDRIYAVIKGGAVNHGGKSSGLTAPHPGRQTELIQQAHRDARVQPRDITYVEAHGTGTSLGDPIEIEGLKGAFKNLDKSNASNNKALINCGVGSVKTNLGHLEAAAGITGVLKVALSFKHKTLPASLHFNSLNQNINLDDSPFYIVAKTRDWPSESNRPRMAGVSSFGSGGANAHIVLEEFSDVSSNVNIEGPFVVIVSAKNPQQLRTAMENLSVFLRSESPDLAALAYTLQVGREPLNTRFACVVSSVAELQGILTSSVAQYSQGECTIDSTSLMGPDSAQYASAENLLELARQWVNGDDIQWSKQWNKKPQRISLPTYPFAKEKHWFYKSSNNDVTELYPLLQRNTSNLKEQKFSSRFHGQEFYLRDHRVKGMSVLPGVAYLDMARAALIQALELSAEQALSIQLNNVVFLQPAVVDKAIEIHISLVVDQSGAITFDIFSEDADAQNDGARVLHSQGAVELKDTQAAVVKSDIDDYLKYSVEELSSEYFYTELDKKGLQYGSTHQAITKINLLLNREMKEVLAEFELPEGLELHKFGLHPSIMDGALQAIYALDFDATHSSSGLALPFSVGSVQQFLDLPQRGYIHASLSLSKNSQLEKIQIKIFNAAGELSIFLQDFCRRTVLKDQATSTLLLSSEWQESPLTPSTSVTLPIKKSWVILCDPATGLIDELQNTFPNLSFLQLLSDRPQASVAEKYTSCAAQLLAYIQAIMAEKRVGKTKIQLLLPATKDGNLYRGLGKMLKTVSLENPKLVGQVLHGLSFDCHSSDSNSSDNLSSDSKAIIAMLKAEQDSGDFDIRYREGSREVLMLREIFSFADSSTAIGNSEQGAGQAWRDNGVYLITGGLGRLGIIFAEQILRSTNKVSLVLTGRSKLNSAKRKTLEQLQAIAKSQASVCAYIPLNFSDYAATHKAVVKTVAKIDAKFGSITGVIHAAGVLRDSFLIRKTEAELSEVFDPKVAGLVALDEVSKDHLLDFFICFSSTSGVLGNVGQADYAAANSFMDDYLNTRAGWVESGERSGLSLAISWPLWQDGGMQVDDATKQRLLLSFGMQALSTSSALSAFSQALTLTNKKSHITVMSGVKSNINSFLHKSDAALPELGSTDHDIPVFADAKPVAGASLAAGAGLTSGAQIPDTSMPTASKSSDYSDELIKEKSRHYFTRLLAKNIKLPAQRINAHEALENYGIDSIMVSQLSNSLEASFGVLSKTLFFEYQTIAEISDYFIAEHNEVLLDKLGLSKAMNTPEEVSVDLSDTNNRNKHKAKRIHDARFISATRTNHSEKLEKSITPVEIAIVGLAGRYPKSENIEAFWNNLTQGKDCVSEIPKARWDLTRYFDPEIGKPGKSHSKWGGFIDGFDQFDPLFFNISPHEAERIDPQERIFLQSVYHTLEDAGYTRESLSNQYPFKIGERSSGANIGVFVGVMYEEYQLYAAQSQDYGLLGNISSIANRASYFCDFHGPSLAVDTMCSSSLTAIHLACESIVRGECDAAIAGGVNLTVHPNKYLALAQGLFVSSNGRCMSFGEGGDGYVPGEGVGSVLLKPLSDAIADKDQIYGVIKSTAINHGGKNNGYTVPNPNAQAAVISKALEKSGVNPRSISYIEAHGTGTSLGDPIEITGLSKAFSEHTDAKSFCAIGSAKSNIGHCESAAGIAGLSKVLLQIKHKTLVPSLHSSPLNPKINFASTPFVVQQELTPWPRPILDLDGHGEREYPRLAGLSSFGAGGANAHLIIEEFIPSEKSGPKNSALHQLPILVVISARDERQLQLQVEQLRRHIEKTAENTDLFSFAYTLQVGREAMNSRLAFIAETWDEVLEKLNGYLNEDSDNDVFIGDVKRHEETISALSEDEDLQIAITSWMQKGKFNKLLDLWAKGLTFNWEILYRCDTYNIDDPSRISLPGYPFVKLRCWVPEISEEKRSGSVAAQTIENIHPLLHKNTSSLFKQRFTSIFDGSESFLSDHVVQGNMFLPAAAFIEMMRVAMIESLELENHTALVFRISHLYFEQPALVDDRTLALELRINDSQENGDDIVEVEISSGLDSDITHVRAQAGFSQVDEGDFLDPIDINGLKKIVSTSLNRASIYSTFSNMGLAYGPAHQALESIQFGENVNGLRFAIGRLNFPSDLHADSSVYELHPSILDGALQACLCLADSQLSSPLLPFSMDSVEVYAAVSSSAYVITEFVSDKNSAVKRFNLDICDNQGNVAVRILGFSLREIQPGKATSKGNELIGELTLAPVWDSFSPSTVALWPESSVDTLILGGNERQVAQLQTHYPNARTLAATGEELNKLLASSKGLEHIFWLLPAATSALTSSSIIDAQNNGVLTGFRLIKSLLAHGYDAKSLGFTVVTLDSVGIANSLSPAHASVFGFLGSLVKEYPQWRFRVVDCQAEDELPISELLSLASDSKAKEIAHRQGQWFQQRLLPCALAKTENPSYRQNGVYVLIGGAGGLGEIFSEHLIRHFQAQIIWLGRRALDETIRGKCERLAEFGPAPYYLSVDASDAEAMYSAKLDIQQRFGDIHGIVHSALVLNDKGLAAMEEATFIASLVAKVDVSVNLVKAFADENLDFVVFFSSLQSLYRPAGQSNYAAGCAFVDAYALALDKELPCPVKSINWGYWGSIGIVASDEYRSRMADVGLGSIEAEEGLALIEDLLASTVPQVVFVKTTKAEVAFDLGADSSSHFLSLNQGPKNTTDLADKPSSQNFIPVSDRDFPLKEQSVNSYIRNFESVLASLLYSQLDTMGLFSSPTIDTDAWKQGQGFDSNYDLWLDESLRSLNRSGYLEPATNDFGISLWRVTDKEKYAAAVLWEKWQVFSAEIHSEKTRTVEGLFHAQVDLVDATLKALPDILRGKVAATDIIFPDSSMDLVEGVYKNNVLSDHYNECLADNLVTDIQTKLKADPQAKIRILEVGAGTGGTSELLFKRLHSFENSIEEYTYTDISKAFLLHAQEKFSSTPYLTTKLFDTSKSLLSQGFELGTYDFVVATNVLHATADIHQTLRNSKALLKKNGCILINELSVNSLFLNLTFGLLSGWWLSTDLQQRIKGSPILQPSSWQAALSHEGYKLISFPASAMHKLGQQIVVAQSDGLIRQDDQPRLEKNRNIQPVVHVDPAPSVRPREISSPEMEVSLSSENSGTTSEGLIKDKLIGFLKTLVAETLKMSVSQLDASEPFASYGVDSILVVRLTNTLRKSMGEISSTLLFERTNLADLADYFLTDRRQQILTLISLDSSTSEPAAQFSTVTHSPSQTLEENKAGTATHLKTRLRKRNSNASSPRLLNRPTQTQENTTEDIAIIGLSGRFPKAANIKEFWQRLSAGENCIEEIPSERWDWRNNFSDKKGELGRIYSKWGGFIEDIDAFDPLFFNISPREAAAMDPQERLFLQCAHETLDDAGYTPENLAKSRRIGVFVGVMNNTYQQQPTHWSIANRVSYCFDFNGPSLSIDTACSSSLSAIIMASESIRSGNCEACIAGGVNLIVDQEHYRGLSSMTMLSAGDKCASFGADADGFVDGEGIGAVLLKPLSQAIAEGAQIYGVIKGGAINHGGKTNGYTVPNPKSQASAISEALKKSNVHPRAISYIEAHGTGTSLGDPIEISGLSSAFSHKTQDKQFCAIGSVKSNMGHSESAAGVVALTKVLLQLKYKKLVPSLHSETLNPNIKFQNTPFKVQRELSDWLRPSFHVDGQDIKDAPRTAGISSFGAGGSNAHLIVQEYIPASDNVSNRQSLLDVSAIILLSAKTVERLRCYVENIIADIDSRELALEDVAYTLQMGRSALDIRIACVVKSVDELKIFLQQYLQSDNDISTGYFGDIREHRDSLSVLSSDEDFKDTLSNWMAKGKYEKLAELWCKGFSVEWGFLYKDRDTHPKRISLPVYPFEKNRYWRKRENSNKDFLQHQASNGQLVPVLHPLLHVNSSTLVQQKYTTHFSGGEFFLEDHMVNGRKTLPVAVLLEMARVAVSIALAKPKSKNTVILSDVVFIQALFAQDQGVVIDVHLTPVDDGAIIFEICTQHNNEERVHAKGRAQHQEPSTQGTEKIDIAEYVSQSQKQFSHADVYATFNELNLRFGERHRAIQTLYFSVGAENVSIAKIVLPSALRDKQEEYVLHPSLLDAALQATLGHLVIDSESIHKPQPFSLKSLQVFSTLPDEMYSLVLRKGSIEAKHELDVDLYLVDMDGNVCAVLLGFTARLSPLNVSHSLSNPALDKDGGERLFASDWEAYTPQWQDHWPESSQRTLVLGAEAQQFVQLSQHFPQAQQLQELKPFGIEEFSIDRLINTLGGNRHYDHIFILLPNSNSKNLSADQIRGEQRYGVYALYRLLKALLALNYAESNLGLTIVTQQSQAINAQEDFHPAHASTHGFSGSLVKEFPQWRIRIVDLAIDEPWPLDQISSLPSDNTGRLSIYRHGQWYRRVLRPLVLPDVSASVFKPVGKYLVLGGAGGVGTEFSRYLISHYQAQVIWLGRREENDSIRQKCDELAELGPRPHYVSVDASNESALRLVHKQLMREFGAVDGIIHSAGAMSGASLLDMDETRFTAGLTAKLDASVCVNQVFSHADLDFSLFFSSLQAFEFEPNQSNYSSATSFTDAFALSLSRRSNYPVKVINWGYIAGTEFVSMKSFQGWMDRRGFAAINLIDSMPVIEKFLLSAIPQLLIHNITNAQALASLPVHTGETIQVLAKTFEDVAAYLPKETALLNPLKADRYADQQRFFDQALAGVLMLQLRDLGLFSAVDRVASKNKVDAWKEKIALPEYLYEWLEESLEVLLTHQYIAKQEDSGSPLKDLDISADELLSCWSECQETLGLQDEFKAQVSLVNAILPNIHAVLCGEKSATQVMFPGSSLDLVEGIYKNNVVSDFFNEVVAESMLVAMEARLQENPQARFKILEIGAGTGGTSQCLFERLSAYTAHIEEYCFTDISTTFLHNAKERFKDAAPYLTTRLFNIEDASLDASLLGQYDFVVASNVLHATKNISHTLRNTKSVLKRNGILLLNELTLNSVFLHLTFGLLEGWWLSEDRHLRSKGSPLLSSQAWRMALDHAGLEVVATPAQSAAGLRHQIFLAKSDGKLTLVADASENGEEKLQLKIPSKSISEVDLEPNQVSRQKVSAIEAIIIEHLSNELELEIQDIHKDRSFSDYGVDSVTGIRLVENINVELSINLRPTSIYDYSTIAKLARHALKQFNLDEAGVGSLATTSASMIKPAAVIVSARTGSDINSVDIKGLVLEVISAALEMHKASIHLDDSFADYGVDSVTGIRIVESINRKLNISLSPTSLFDFSSVNKLQAHILVKHVNTLSLTEKLEKLPQQERLSSACQSESISRVESSGRNLVRPRLAPIPSSIGLDKKSLLTKSSEVGKDLETDTPNTLNEPIAIIGMSGRFAKANNVDEFWNYLANGEDITEAVTRWDLSQCEGSSDASFCDRGGFLRDVDCFDSLFFNISGVEAAYMDPQQRVFLEEAWRTLEDAGYAGESIEGLRCGVFAGCNGSDYADLFVGEKSPAQALWGNAASLLSARIAYYLDLRGPAITIDTACSSSLSAIHMACQSIRAGETELALAGGAFIQSTAKFYEMANRAKMLSPDGRCHTFDDGANGFVPGEAVAVLMLKTLSGALRDGDHIYGVVHGSAMNQDGTTNGITAPSAHSQEELIREVYKKYKVEPKSIQVVEAHGTGTKLGDPIEFEALTNAFEKIAADNNSGLDRNYCALGALKTNIGHATAASGVAGVIKLLMSLKHKKIAPSLNYHKPNRHIRLAESPFYISTELRHWPSNSGAARRSVISSFGLSGTNVHAVIDEAPEQKVRAVEQSGYLIVLSAQSDKSLRKQAELLLNHCRENSLDCASLSYTLALGRKHFSHRFSCVVSNVNSLIGMLNGWLQGESGGDLFSSQDAISDAENVNDVEIAQIIESFRNPLVDNDYINHLKIIALAYSQGSAFSFKHLFTKGQYGRISLPTYSFTKTRSWVPMSSDKKNPFANKKALSQFGDGAEKIKRDVGSALQSVNQDDSEYEKLFDSLMSDDISIDQALDFLA